MGRIERQTSGSGRRAEERIEHSYTLAESVASKMGAGTSSEKKGGGPGRYPKLPASSKRTSVRSVLAINLQ